MYLCYPDSIINLHNILEFKYICHSDDILIHHIKLSRTKVIYLCNPDYINYYHILKFMCRCDSDDISIHPSY